MRLVRRIMVWVLLALSGLWSSQACTPGSLDMSDDLSHQDSLDLLLSVIRHPPVSYQRSRLVAVCLEPTTRNLGEMFPERGIPRFPAFSASLLKDLEIALEDETGFPVHVGCTELGHPLYSFSEEQAGTQVVRVEISMPVRVARDTAWVAHGRRSHGVSGFDPAWFFIVGKWVRNEGGWKRVDAVAIS